MSKLLSTNEEKLKEAFEFQREKIGWTFYDERKFAENLLQTRFNFLIATYALFMNALFLCKDSKLICLVVGFFVTTIMGFTVYRIYVKAMILLDFLYVLGANHVLSIQSKEADTRKGSFFPVNLLIGIVIPILLSLSFVLGIVLFVFFGYEFK